MKDGRKRLILGVGINDTNILTQKVINNKRVFNPTYLMWKNMLGRCYLNNDFYKHVNVCEEWLKLSSFMKWVENNYTEGLYLDKDILGDGTLYSPSTCAFVTQECNQFFSSFKKKGKYSIGVSKDRRKISIFYTHYRGFYVGCYHTEKQAHIAWQKEKLNHAKSLAKSESDTRIRERLLEVVASIESDILLGVETCGL